MAYTNKKHGFVDPLTGALIWVGFGLVLCARRRSNFRTILMAGFLIVWLVVGLLMTRNPAFCRFLVVLPFATFLATEGVLLAGGRLALLLRSPRPRLVALRFAWGTAALIFAWNGKIFYDYYDQAMVEGENVAATIRYAHKQNAGGLKDFYLVTDDRYLFQPYGGDFWQTWLKTQLPDHCSVVLVRPEKFLTAEPITFIPRQVPCVVFMNGELWGVCKERLLKQYPDIRAVPLMQSGAQISLEIPAQNTKDPRPP